MTCIVLDMEWSQPVTKEKTIVSGMLSLPVEIIQIGAVIVQDGKIVNNMFSEYVKPKYYTTIKSKIKKLTGIDEKKLHKADSFQKVMNAFKEWCAPYKPDIIATWGNDDVPLLKSQSSFFGYDDSWLPGFFNLQPIFTRQYNIDRPQINLMAAIELIGAGGGLDFHSAINDAYYTALILQKIDNLESRISWQKKVDYAHANPYISFKATVFGDKRYSRIASAFHNKLLRGTICPICGKPVLLSGRFVCVKPREYLTIIRCAKHSVAICVSFTRESDKKYSWIRTASPSTKQQEQLYYELMTAKKNEQLRKVNSASEQ